MIKRYYLVRDKNKKYEYYKKVPYITNKNFKRIKNYKISGITKLNAYKNNSKEKTILSYNYNNYVIKNKMLGITKGYIDIGNNNYIILKNNISSVFFLILIGLILLLFSTNYSNNLKINEKTFKNSISEIPSIRVDEVATSNVEEQGNKNIEIIRGSNDAINYTISFNSNGGKGTMDNIDCVEGNSIILTKNKFIKDGYTFIGWSIVKDGDVVYNDNSIIDSVDENTTLYAVWKVNTYNIKYRLDGGVIKNKISNYNILSNNIKIDNPIKKGYTFNGWKISKNKKLVKNYVIEKGSFGSIELIATYTPNLYKITFNTNSSLSNFKEKNIYYDSYYGDLPTPIKYGYKFLNWLDQDNNIIDKTSIYSTSSDMILTANYKANTYKVSFNPNKGMLDDISINIDFGNRYGMLPTPIREGYIFKGWYYKGESIDKDTILTKAFDHELIANWEKIEYKINYNLNGGVISNNILKYNIESETVILPAPVKEGYNFIGWTGSNGDIPQKSVTIEKGSIGNKNYEAHFERKHHTVYYYVNNSLWTTKEVYYGDTIDNLVYGTDSYHKFSGWNNFQNIMKDNDINLYGTVNYTRCKVETGHGSYDRVSTFPSVFARAGFNAWIIDSPMYPGNYIVTTNQIYEYPTAVSMLNYVWNNTSAGGAHSLNWMSLICDNGTDFSIERPVI